MNYSLLAELQTHNQRRHLAKICLDAHVLSFRKSKLQVQHIPSASLFYQCYQSLKDYQSSMTKAGKKCLSPKHTGSAHFTLADALCT